VQSFSTSGAILTESRRRPGAPWGEGVGRNPSAAAPLATVEEVEAEQPVVGVRVVAQPRVVRGVGEQPGQELDRDADQQDEPEQRRQPRPTHRALPSGPRERPILATRRRPEPAWCRRRRGRGPTLGHHRTVTPEPEHRSRYRAVRLSPPRDAGNRPGGPPPSALRSSRPNGGSVVGMVRGGLAYTPNRNASICRRTSTARS